MDGSDLAPAGSAPSWRAGAKAPEATNTEFSAIGHYRVLKRMVDVLGALALGVVFSPLIAGVTLILLRQGGPVFFSHTRIGRSGKPFKVLKFRTMVPNAQQILEELLAASPEMQAEWDRDHKLKDDPRITRTGRFLRKTSLDELPQIWNVLKGEMSLVGPRPVVEAELEKYGRAVRYYFASKPGITGLWQVSGRNDTDYRRRVVMDRRYARDANLFLDVKILLRTVLVVVHRRGAY
jgi:Undecaprenyl-phosphate galactose phosphotransferase WbaP